MKLFWRDRKRLPVQRLAVATKPLTCCKLRWQVATTQSPYTPNALLEPCDLLPNRTRQQSPPQTMAIKESVYVANRYTIRRRLVPYHDDQTDDRYNLPTIP